MKEVGLIGLGKWGKNILRELVLLNCEVVVVLNTKNLEREEWLRGNYPSVRFVYDREIIKDAASIENVFIATPVETHYDVASYFILAGKNVFLEKPITDSASSAQSLFSLVGQHETHFFVGHIFLYHECFFRLRELLKKEDVIDVAILKTARVEEPITSSKRLFFDSFIHELSIILRLFGQPKGTVYQKKNNELTMSFDGFIVSVMIEKFKEKKIRQFKFEQKNLAYIWSNDELYKKGIKKAICVPNEPALRNEINLFLNEFDKYNGYINENNSIAVQSVEILDNLWKNL